MNAKEIAEALTGKEYGDIPKEISRAAANSGLVIVYGASDDLMEFEGAIHDETYGPGTIRINKNGIVPEFDQIDKDDEEALSEYFQNKNEGSTIKSIWGRDGYSWQYETTIPHDTFEMVEDGQPYCRGIVFSLEDV